MNFPTIPKEQFVERARQKILSAFSGEITPRNADNLARDLGDIADSNLDRMVDNREQKRFTGKNWPAIVGKLQIAKLDRSPNELADALELPGSTWAPIKHFLWKVVTFPFGLFLKLRSKSEGDVNGPFG